MPSVIEEVGGAGGEGGVFLRKMRGNKKYKG